MTSERAGLYSSPLTCKPLTELMIVKFDIELMNPKADPDNYVFEFALTSDRGTLVFRLNKSEYEQLGSAIANCPCNWE